MHEAVQAAELTDPLRTRTQHQMIGVAEDDVRARGRHVFGEHGLHRGARSDRHESRSAYLAARRFNETEARGTVPRLQRERKRCGHAWSSRLSKHASP